jgi:WhiB family redox-sensing transcriptional regulator
MDMTWFDGWRAQAECAGLPIQWFFPERSSSARDRLVLSEIQAKAICIRCPVRRECLSDMYDYEPEQEGVWGGTLPRERREVGHLPVDVRIEALLIWMEEQADALNLRRMDERRIRDGYNRLVAAGRTDAV